MKYKFSIRKKMFLVILAPALVVVLVILIDYRNINVLGRSAEQILSENYKSINAALQIRLSLENNQNQLLYQFFQTHQSASTSLQQKLDIEPILNICRENITEPGEKKIIEGLYEILEIYRIKWDGIVNNQLPISLLDNQIYSFIETTDSFNDELNDLILLNEQGMEAAENRTRLIADQTIHYSIGLLIAAIIFSFILSFLLSGRISRPLTILAEIMAKIKEGSGRYPQININTNDEIGFLSEQFNRLFERLEAFDHRSAEQFFDVKSKADQAEIAKSSFIANLSHQLKTPMTSISMSIGLLFEKGDALPDIKRKKLIQTAMEECLRLTSLINELVDIAKLESMVRPMQKEILEIDRIVNETLQPLIHQAEEKGVQIKIQIDKHIPPVAIDSLRFPWVLTNLVGNAIRYTDSGGIVEIMIKKEGHRCAFQCIDSGSGIDPAFLPKIFDRYTQFSEREKSGTIGLGLAIVKEIIELHGGDISVKSRLGRGTIFEFWIPIGDSRNK
ncbi:MAG: ATP-binding protein [Desulfobacteraceae bacterium]|jgi:signal transduction histidine kinase|nr:ATP-binding protein [Desulfobacteraceae bacterium]